MTLISIDDTQNFTGTDTEPTDLPAAALPLTTPRGFSAKLRKPWFLVAATVVLVAATVGGSLVALTKSVTITVDGQDRVVSTLSGSVNGALRVRRHRPGRARHAGAGR